MLSGVGDPEALGRLGIEVKARCAGRRARTCRITCSAILIYRRKEPGPFQAMMRLDRIGRALSATYLFGNGFGRRRAGRHHRVSEDRSAGDAAGPAVPVHRRASRRLALFHAVQAAVSRQLRHARRLCQAGEPRIHQPMSADPAARRRIFIRIFSPPMRDWRRVREGVRLARDIAAQPSMAAFVAAEARARLRQGERCRDRRPYPRHARSPFITRSAPARWAPMVTTMQWLIPSSRCAGSEGLRIVDASVMPDAICGNINAAVDDDRREGRRHDPRPAAAEPRRFDRAAASEI